MDHCVHDCLGQLTTTFWILAMKLKAPLAIAVAIAVGLVVLLGYFFPVLLGLRQFLLQWAIVLAAIALFIGMINLLATHVRKVTQKDGTPVYSSILILSLVITFILVLGLGPQNTWSAWVFTYIQLPVEASLMGVLAISMAYASTRLIRRRPDIFSLIFTITALLVLLGTGPLLLSVIPGAENIFVNLRNWIAQVPATAGGRGILLGVALGTIATGLRILMGADKPYGG